MIYNLVLLCGRLAILLGIFAMGIFLLKLKFFQKFSLVKNCFPKLFKSHKYIGGTAIILATFHGVGMVYYNWGFLGERFIQAGILALAVFWLTGAAAFTMKRIAPEKKKLFFKLHKSLGISILFFVFLHIYLQH